jgi:hypothetical protein
MRNADGSFRESRKVGVPQSRKASSHRYSGTKEGQEVKVCIHCTHVLIDDGYGEDVHADTGRYQCTNRPTMAEKEK